MITPPIQDEIDVLATEELEELNILLKQVMESMMPADVKVKCLAMLNRLKKLVKYGTFSKEFEPVEQYLGWILKIPWGKNTSDNLDLNLAKAQLDKTHYGLEEVKERIMEYIAILNLLSKQDAANNSNSSPDGATQLYSGNYKSKAPIICFVGVQGIGKTSIAKSIAAALGRKFIRIPLGGLADIKELRGVNKSQINAEPGQVVKAFVRTGVMNPLILLDELDKVSAGGGVNADIMAALLEILDPEQNANFTDHYMDFPIDLSKCVFIATANNLGGITAALLDRLEVIRMTSYSDDEKIHIAKDYLLPNILDQCGLKPENLIFEEEVWPLIVRPFGFDAGMRQLERNLNQVVRKVAKRILTENAMSYKVTAANFREFFPQDIGVYS
jgi:ATP-dependent Lon protease